MFKSMTFCLALLIQNYNLLFSSDIMILKDDSKQFTKINYKKFNDYQNSQLIKRKYDSILFIYSFEGYDYFCDRKCFLDVYYDFCMLNYSMNDKNRYLFFIIDNSKKKIFQLHDFNSKCDISKLYVNKNYYYFLYYIEYGSFAIYRDDDSTRSAGIILFNRNNPMKYSVFEFQNKKFLKLEEIDNKFHVITEDLIPSYPWFNKIFSKFISRVPKGEFTGNGSYTEYYYNLNLQLLSNKKISKYQLDKLLEKE